MADDREQRTELVKIFGELGSEDRKKLLNVGEIMLALKNLPSTDPPKATA